MSDEVLIEVYCGSIDDAEAAEKGGADRIELNSALFLGGLTPSAGALKEVKNRVDIPVMAMIRPRAGGFCYTDNEFRVMKKDTAEAIKQGVDGIVCGILNEDGTIDTERCREIIEIVGDREVVFHRAFDVVPDPWRAVDKLIELGFDRILTKGQGNRIEAGMELLQEIIEYVEEEIEILPGGIKPFNYDYVLNNLDCDQVHISAMETKRDLSTQRVPGVYFGSSLRPAEDEFQTVSKNGVESLSHKIKKQNR